MKLSTCTLLAALLLAPARTAEAKAYKGAEVYSLQSVLHGRMEMRMRMIRGSGLLSTFFTYKNGSEMAGSTWEETDVEVLGKNDAKTWQSNLITGNPRMTSEQVYSATSSLADGYHTYTLEWTPDYVSWSFDGTMVRKTEGGQASSLINPETPSLQRLGEQQHGLGRRARRQRRCPPTSSSTGSSTTGTTTASSCSTGPTTSTASIPAAGPRATGRSTATSSTSIRRTRSFRTAR